MRSRTDPGKSSVHASAPAGISVHDVCRSFQRSTGETHRVLDGVTFDVPPGTFTCIVGPSGAGKTTLLRCMGGLLTPSSGEVRFAGEAVTEPPRRLAPVFQDYSRSLLPWMSVERNITLPLRASGMGKRAMRERAREALDAVGLGDVGQNYPWQLSGGMQQRVAIARALAYGPDAMLMDEPFASVDPQTRNDLEDLILDVRARLGLTVALVTHDIDEAVYLGDRVIVLSGAPARVTESIEIGLEQPRDQLRTKSDPRFVELRARVYSLVRRPAPDDPQTQPASAGVA